MFKAQKQLKHIDNYSFMKYCEKNILVELQLYLNN